MRYLPLFCVMVSGFSLENSPWLNTPFECYLQTGYTYSYFDQVSGAHPAAALPWNSHLFSADLSIAPSAYWDIEGEAQWVDTPVQSFSYRSAAIQGRYQLWNDVAGDPLSIVFGSSLREVSGTSLHDVSCPYHATLNFELTAAFGKEWSSQGQWKWRAWTLIGLGQGNRGSPWTRAICALEKKMGAHQLLGFAEGYFGWGSQNRIHVHHFNGWGSYHHQSVDVGLAYAYHFKRYGHLRISGAYRPYAHVFPMHATTLMLIYQLPFSVF